jgi:hypothetical protein
MALTTASGLSNDFDTNIQHVHGYRHRGRLQRNTDQSHASDNATPDCRSIIRLTGIQNLAGRCKLNEKLT